MAQLAGKVAWVTGAGTGIGEAAAIALAAEGAAVVLSGRRAAPLEAVAERIRAAGGTAEVRAADLAKSAEVEAAAAAVVAQHGRLDLVVSNAGGNIVDRSWGKLTPDGIDTLVQANLLSATYVMRAVLPQMRKQGGGTLIHTTSFAGKTVGSVGGPVYSAAKNAVIALSHSINAEECVNNIRSCALVPGEVNTPILQQRPNPLSAEQLARMLQPADVAEAIRWVACLPPHVCINELWITPTHNRGYIAALQRAL